MTTATSSDAPHRGHRWPGETRANLSFPFRSISAGTVCVHMGHSACPLVWLSIIAFINPALHSIGRSNPRKSCIGIVKNLKNMYNLGHPAEGVDLPHKKHFVGQSGVRVRPGCEDLYSGAGAIGAVFLGIGCRSRRR